MTNKELEIDLDNNPFPKDWTLDKLENLTIQIIDGTHYTPEYVEYGVPFLRVTDIQNSEIDLEKVKYVSEQEYNILNRRCNPEYGDILCSKNGTIGIVKVINWNWRFSIFVSLALIKPKHEIVYNKFLMYILNSDFIWKQIKKRSKQGTVTNLHLEEIRDFTIPLPKYNEQKHIAEILETIDNNIEKTQKIIDKYNKIKDGLFQDILLRGVQTNGRLRPRYSESPDLYRETNIGVYPVEWEVDCLENVLERLIDYRGKTPSKTSSGIPLITAKNIRYGYICEEPKEYISEEDYDLWMTRGLPKVGDVLFTTEAPLANVAQITDEKIALAQRVVTLRTSERLINTFLKYILMADQVRQQIFSRSSGTTALGIKQSLLRKVLIPFPKDIEEQMKIINVLETYDRRIEKEELHIRKLSKIKEGLMQDLLTGKVRVKVEGDGDE